MKINAAKLQKTTKQRTHDTGYRIEKMPFHRWGAADDGKRLEAVDIVLGLSREDKSLEIGGSSGGRVPKLRLGGRDAFCFVCVSGVLFLFQLRFRRLFCFVFLVFGSLRGPRGFELTIRLIHFPTRALSLSISSFSRYSPKTIFH